MCTCHWNHKSASMVNTL